MVDTEAMSARLPSLQFLRFLLDFLTKFLYFIEYKSSKVKEFAIVTAKGVVYSAASLEPIVPGKRKWQNLAFYIALALIFISLFLFATRRRMEKMYA